jgi:putative transposase
MVFNTGHLYHIYNKGNNRQPVFFLPENYRYFINKIDQHILPYCDILAWCLMPNHFHLMVYVHTLDVVINNESLTTDESKTLIKSDSLTLSETITKKLKVRNLNDSIGLMLRSYTRAINKQENRTGSLFKPHTKSVCLTISEIFSPLYLNTGFGTEIILQNNNKGYPQICFNYIHANPVSAKLVKAPVDWKFSSFRDYWGLGDDKLINKKRAEEFNLVIVSL